MELGSGVFHQLEQQQGGNLSQLQSSGVHDSKILVGRLLQGGGTNGQNTSSSSAAAPATSQMLMNNQDQTVPEQQQQQLLLQQTSNKNTAAAAGKSSSKSSSKVVHYRECMKNHAASIGGHALDGCGEFIPSGEEGSIEALKCAACDCHRNFHKREVEGEPLICDICHLNRRERNRKAAALAAGVSNNNNTGAVSAAAAGGAPASSKQLMAIAGGESQQQNLNLTDHHQVGATLHGGGSSSMMMKKRFRTKFSIDQKERMFLLAEKLGWRIQKQDEATVQQFCAEMGVKRHVLKVWMHNNKHTFGKRSSSGATTPGGASPGGAMNLIAAPPQPLHFNLSSSTQPQQQQQQQIPAQMP